MANKTFVSNSTLTISDNLTEAVGSSVTGQDNVKIRAGVTGVKLDANFERIDLSGTLASYKFVVVSGTGLQIQNADSSVVATIPNINQSVKIAFTDGSATLAQTGATVFTLNSAALVVGATGAAATVSLGANVLSTAAGETSTVATTAVTVLATNASKFTGSIVDADILDVGTFTLTSAAELDGGLGLGFANTLAVKDTANIASGVIGNFTGLLFNATGVSLTNDLTMNASQHAGFTGAIIAAGTGTNGEQITITDAFTGTGLVNVENYVLGATSNFTLTATAQNVTGSAASDTITGGISADTIDGSGGSDNISGGAGSDSLTGGAGSDTISGGTGVDTFVMTSGTEIDTITDWNAGGDQDIFGATNYSAAGTLKITIANDAGNSGTLDLNTVLGSGGAVASVTGGNGSDNITGGAGADTISGGANADTITGGSGSDTINGGDGDDIIQTTATLFVGSSALLDSIDGGNGNNDTILFKDTAATVTIASSDDFARIANVEIIKTVANTSAISITRDAATKTTTGFTTIDLSGDTSNTGTNVVSITGANSITTIIGSAGIDQVSVLTAAPATSVTGGLGIDTFTITAPAAAITITDLGNDADTFTTATSGTTNATLYASSNAVSYAPASGTVGASTTVVITAPVGTTTATVDLNAVGNSGSLTLNAGNAGSTTTLTLPTTAGKISVTGGAGVDTIVAAGTLTSDVSINGGAGTGDILSYATTGNISAATITGVEKLTFAGTNTLTAAQLDGFTLLTGSSTPNLAVTTAVTAAMLDDAVIATDATTITLGNFANAITAKNATVAAGNKLSIVQATTSDTGVLTFDGRLELDGKFSVTGAAGDDIMYSGASSLVGGAGADTLIGGAGNDTFYVANTNKDYVTNKTITGGSGTADKLVLTVAGTDLVAANFATVTQVEVIEFTGTTTAVFGSTPAGVTKVIGGSGATTLTSLVANLAALNIDLATNHGTSFVAGTTGATTGSAYTVTADPLTTSINLAGITGTVTGAVVAAAGNLAFQESTASTGTTTLTGGNAANTITVGGVTPATAIHTFDASAVLSKVNYTSAAGVQTITTGGAADTIKAGDGADVLDGGAGDDVFSYAAFADFMASNAVVDTITGGDGTDTISVTGAFAIASGDSMARVGTVEKLVAATQSASALTQSIVINGDAVLSSVRTIDLSGDTHATSTGNIVLTGVTVDATLKGVAAGLNTLIGGAGSDVITGGSGVDKITGAAKADTIDAGAGADILYYLAAADLFTSNASVDSIVGGDGVDVITIGDGSNTDFTIASANAWTRISAVETIQTVASSGMVSVTLSISAQTAGINKVDLALATKTTTNVIDVSAFTTTATTLIGPSSTGNADITGGGAADIITAGAAGGTIIGGGAADSITGAAGVDIIKWAATTSAALATETGSTAGGAVTFAAGTVGDKVATWTSNTDKLHFSRTLTDPAGTDSDTLKVISKTGGTIANTDRFVHISDTVSGDAVDTTAGAVTVLNALTTSAVTIGASTIVAMDNDTNIYLWLVKQVSTADTIATQDITLIGMVAGITTVTNGDFVSFA